MAARHDEPVFEESYGEPITRASLFDSIRRALALVRLPDAFLAGGAATAMIRHEDAATAFPDQRRRGRAAFYFALRELLCAPAAADEACQRHQADGDITPPVPAVIAGRLGRFCIYGTRRVPSPPLRRHGTVRDPSDSVACAQRSTRPGLPDLTSPRDKIGSNHDILYSGPSFGRQYELRRPRHM
jgi:hypothetical protein